MGYAYEAYSTAPVNDYGPDETDPESWSGDVNTNIQVR
jgi:RAT1-interacting protein